MKDYEDIKKNYKEFRVVIPDNKNKNNWIVTFQDPGNSNYDGGTFAVNFIFPDNYPRTPPYLRFLTKIWHPNISSQNGSVDVYILASMGTYYTIRMGM